jgi:hypothetical protein
MIMTPEQITALLSVTRDCEYIDVGSTDGYGFTIHSNAPSEAGVHEWCDTLAAYVEIVQKVAECDPYCDDSEFPKFMYGGGCHYCEGHSLPNSPLEGTRCPHAPDCLYLAARKLRGLE